MRLNQRPNPRDRLTKSIHVETCMADWIETRDLTHDKNKTEQNAFLNEKKTIYEIDLVSLEHAVNNEKKNNVQIN